ncbi:MAG: hypothetical protein OXU62_00850 [Gammaproteobacteria bacterium]|nr:hypothetical protein [Gammaproteobacteria bacterium]
MVAGVGLQQRLITVTVTFTVTVTVAAIIVIVIEQFNLVSPFTGESS